MSGNIAVAAAWDRLTDIADEQAERDAIQAEAPLPPQGTPARHKLDRDHAAMCRGLMAVSRYRHK